MRENMKSIVVNINLYELHMFITHGLVKFLEIKYELQIVFVVKNEDHY